MNQQQAAAFGAHETMEMHEVLTETINCINTFQLFQQHVTDQSLRQILDRQLDFLSNEYNNMVNALHTHGRGQAVPYRAQKGGTPKYGLRQPAQETPNASFQQLDDRDIASCMLSSAKCGATMRMHAALECADPMLRSMMLQAAQNSAEMAYETWAFMNQKRILSSADHDATNHPDYDQRVPTRQRKHAAGRPRAASRPKLETASISLPNGSHAFGTKNPRSLTAPRVLFMAGKVAMMADMVMMTMMVVIMAETV